MSISGDVSIMGLPQVFELISSNGLGGSLSVVTKGKRIRIPFCQGAIQIPLEGGPTKPRSGIVNRTDLKDLFSRGQALRRPSSDEHDRPAPPPQGARRRRPSGRPGQDRPAGAPPRGPKRPPSSANHRRPGPGAPAQRPQRPPSAPGHRRPGPRAPGQRPGRPPSSSSHPRPPTGRLGPPGSRPPARRPSPPPSGQRGRAATNPQAARTKPAQRPTKRTRDELADILGRARNLPPEDKLTEVSEVLLGVFSWTPATFAFHPEPPPPALLEAIEQGQTLTIDPNGLLLEAARRLDESEQSASVTETWGSSVRIRRGFLAGSLSGVGLAAVLQTLQAERLSGTLSISGDEGEQQLYFKRGEAFLFRRDDTDAESLREFLGESWEEKVVFARHSGATGCVHEDDLPEVEVEALKEAFFDTLFWHDAQFEFLLDALPEDFEEPEGATRIALHSSRFLLQVVGRLQEWDELSREVGGEQAVYRFATPAAKLEAVQTFGPPELLTLIDGRISLGELARRTGLEILEVARVVRDLRTINLIARV